uniref:Uncharacterized protein n=1 Tax=Spermophilus dauricus TaxID=99837 RepID=A0A8C9NZP8_SPEDA
MRHNHNKLNLHTTNRPKIPHRLLVSKSHSTSNCSNYDSNPLKLYGSYSTNNCPRINIFYIILSSKH